MARIANAAADKERSKGGFRDDSTLNIHWISGFGGEIDFRAVPVHLGELIGADRKYFLAQKRRKAQ